MANGSAPSTSFSDLDGVAASKRVQIQEAQKQGLLAGDPSGLFRPTELLTRQELAALLVKALKLPHQSGTDSSFADVPATGWGTSAIEAVAQAGLMIGDGQGAFRPEDPVSREELAAVFVRAVNGIGARGGLKTNVQDAQQVSPWATPLVDAAVRLGLIDTPDAKLSPQGLVQREQIAGFLLDIFQAGVQTKTISSVDGDVITIDGKQFLVDDKWKRLLGEGNTQALEGAVVRFRSANRNIDDLSDLEIVKDGVVLNASGTPFAGSLKISGDGVTVRGDSLGQLTLANGVSRVDIDAQIESLVVDGGQAVQLNGNVHIATLQVTNPLTKLTLGNSVEIGDIQLPKGVRLSQVIENLHQVSERIKRVLVGIDDRTPPSPQEPKPNPTNHAPSVKNTISAVTAKVTDNLQAISLAGVFEDEDQDALTYSAASSNMGVATVAVDGANLSITPLTAGITTITVTADDRKGGTVQTQFTVTLTPADAVNNAPTVKNAISQVTTYAGDQDTTISLDQTFEDQDGDALTYSANSSDTGVATVSVTGDQLSITPLQAGTVTITVTADDSNGGTVQTHFDVTVQASKTLFFSELVWGDGALQAIELYNPTDRDIDTTKIRIERDDDGEPITIHPSSLAAIPKGSTTTIGESFYEGDIYFDYYTIMSLNPDSPVTLKLFYEDQLLDTAVFTPFKSIARVSGTVRGSGNSYNLSQWEIQADGYTDGLNSYTP